jgi:hypothetical protein
VQLAALPAWFADNAALITIVVLSAVTILVIWVIQATAVRIAVISIGAVLALFVYVNRGPIEGCARTCECQLAGQDVTVPLCDPGPAG